MHFLRQDESRGEIAVGRPYAVAHVRVDGTQLRLDGGIGVARADTLFVPLPERVQVVDLNGQVMKPSKGKRFWVSTESFDPHHLVLEAKILPL